MCVRFKAFIKQVEAVCETDLHMCFSGSGWASKDLHGCFLLDLWMPKTDWVFYLEIPKHLIIAI